MPDIEKLSASLEDYVQAIHHIVAEKQAARAKDIAGRLNVNNSSVTGALRTLSEKGVVNYVPYDVITLTAKGKKYAKDIVRRHEALRDFFVKVLCVDATEAEENACRMEHSVSRNILNRLIRFVEFVEICPRGGEDWLKGFWKHSQNDEPYERCEKCITLRLEDLIKKKKELEEDSKVVSLEDLNPGQRGKILKIKGRNGINKRLADMGITSGSVIEVERVDPMGDPIDVKIKGYHLSLRKEEASRIKVGLYRR